MHYDKANERIPVAPIDPSRSAPKQDYRQNSDIRRTRTIVLILLGIQLVFAIYYFIQKCVDLGKYNNLPAVSRDEKLAGSYIGSVIAAAISVVYVIIFILVVVKYIRIGILIFAWLGLIELILILIVLILAIIAITAISAGNYSVGIGIAASVVVIIIAALSCLLTILTVVFSFKLAKLIKMHEAYLYV